MMTSSVPKRVLKAIKDESKASSLYPSLARELTKRGHIREGRTLRGIAKDEKRHKKLLQKMSKRLEKKRK